MTDDLVQLLRLRVIIDPGRIIALRWKAADEIERLRVDEDIAAQNVIILGRQIDELHAEIERLTQFRDQVLREYDMQVSVIFPSIEYEQRMNT